MRTKLNDALKGIKGNSVPIREIPGAYFNVRLLRQGDRYQSLSHTQEIEICRNRWNELHGSTNTAPRITSYVLAGVTSIYNIGLSSDRNLTDSDRKEICQKILSFEEEIVTGSFEPSSVTRVLDNKTGTMNLIWPDYAGSNNPNSIEFFSRAVPHFSRSPVTGNWILTSCSCYTEISIDQNVINKQQELLQMKFDSYLRDFSSGHIYGWKLTPSWCQNLIDHDPKVRAKISATKNM